MKKTLLAGTCCVALVGGTAGALAGGPYAAIQGGIDWTNVFQYDEPNNNNYMPIQPEHGFGGAVALGFIAGAALRSEAELTGRGNSFTNTTDFEGTVAGNLRVFAAMANAWLDLNPGGHIVPYIGAGVGVANVHFNLTNDGHNNSLPGSAIPDANNIDNSDTVLAYQLGAGVGVGLGGMAMLTLDYRFLGTHSYFVEANTPGFGTEGSIKNHSVMVGLRMNFEPPPPPPPAP
jgi:opacity protein-like surface antigen